MRAGVRRSGFLIICLLLVSALKAGEISATLFPAELQAEYIIYSYDYDFASASQLTFSSSLIEIKANRAFLDFEHKTILFESAVSVKFAKESAVYDQLLIDMNNGSIIAEKIFPAYEQKIILNKQEKIEKGKQSASGQLKNRKINFSRLLSSLIYLTMKKLIVRKDLTPFGYDCLLYLENIPSLQFNKFKLSSGIEEFAEKKPVSLEKINFIPGRGLFMKILIDAGKKASAPVQTKLTLETGGKPPFKEESFTLQSELTVQTALPDNVSFNIQSRYNWQKNWQTDLFLIKRSAFDKSQHSLQAETKINFSYLSGLKSEAEHWFQFQQTLQKPGFYLNFDFQFALNEQKSINLSFRKQLAKNLHFSLSDSYRHLRQLTRESRQNQFKYSLSYQSGIVSLDQSGSLHNDYLFSQTTSNTALNFRILPLKFYAGLLNFSTRLNLELANFNTNGEKDNSNNLFFQFQLNSVRLEISRLTDIGFQISAENLFSSQTSRSYWGLNYSLNFKHLFSPFLQFELDYHYHSRRQLKNFFITGNAVQTAVGKIVLNFREKFNLQTLFFYDLELNRMKNLFLGQTIAFSKNWSAETLLNYDLLLKRTIYEIFITRKAGRFQFYCGYRSISQQFILELRPLN